MKKSGIHREQGQSLIIIAVAMTVLLIFSAFAIDLAYWYVERRQMQNAADAGALAGARALAIYQVDPSESLTDGQLYSLILDWAQRNGAHSVQALYVAENGSKYPISAGSGAPAPKNYSAATGVHVVATVNVPTFFASVLGVRQMTASAEAEASYGSAWTASGLVPLAFRWHSDEVFAPGTPYTLFAGNDKKAPAEWGWLGLDCPLPQTQCSPDSNELTEWMRNGYPGEVQRNTSYMGDPGIKAAVLKEAYVGKYIIIPLFDQVFQFTKSDLDANGNPRCLVDAWGHPVPGQYEGWSNSGGYGQWDPNSYCATECNNQYLGIWCAHTDDNSIVNSYYYHVIEFAAFYVTAVTQGGHRLEGYFDGFVVEGSETHPSQWDKGVVVIKLTE